MNILPLPEDLCKLTFSLLEPMDLCRASLVCKKWYRSFNKIPFLQLYAQSRSLTDMASLTPDFFHKLLPHFTSQQLCYIDGKKITRHFLHNITEDKINKINLRFVKLVTSIEWYRQVLLYKWDEYSHYKIDLSMQKKVEECKDYIHIFLLLQSWSGMMQERKWDEKTLNEFRDFQITPTIDLLQYGLNEAIPSIDMVIMNDFIFLKTADGNRIDELFFETFNKYNIVHIINPRGSPFLRLPDFLFKSLFKSLIYKHIENSNEDTHSKMDLLSITTVNDTQLSSLSHWFETTKINIEKLNLNLGTARCQITLKGLIAFKNSLKQSNVKSIEFFEMPLHPELNNILQEITLLFPSKIL